VDRSIGTDILRKNKDKLEVMRKNVLKLTDIDFALEGNRHIKLKN